MAISMNVMKVGTNHSAPHGPDWIVNLKKRNTNGLNIL